jgi:hypothetical protein
LIILIRVEVAIDPYAVADHPDHLDEVVCCVDDAAVDAVGYSGGVARYEESQACSRPPNRSIHDIPTQIAAEPGQIVKLFVICPTSEKASHPNMRPKLVVVGIITRMQRKPSQVPKTKSAMEKSKSTQHGKNAT